MIVNRLQRPVGGIAQKRVDPTFKFTREQADAHVARSLEIGLRFGQHGDTTRNVKSTYDDRHTSGTKWTRDIESAWKLIRLDTNQCNHAESTVTAKIRHQRTRVHALANLINYRNVESDIWPNDLSPASVLREAVDNREAV